MLRRSSDPSNLASPAPGVEEASISNSPLLRSKSPLKPRSKGLYIRHSSEGSTSACAQPELEPSALPSVAESSKLKPRHVRAQSRFAGRFEVLDFDLLSNSLGDSNNPLKAASPPKTKKVNVQASQSQRKDGRVLGRFQVCDIADSPPKAESAIGIRRVQSAQDAAGASQEFSKADLLSTREGGSGESEKIGDSSVAKTMPHASLVGRFQVIEMPHDGTFQQIPPPPALYRQSELNILPTHARINSSPEVLTRQPDLVHLMSAVSIPAEKSDSSSHSRNNSNISMMGELETSDSSLESKSSLIGDPVQKTQAELDALDPFEMLLAVNRKMQAMVDEINRLREENRALKIQLNQFTHEGGIPGTTQPSLRLM